MEEGMTEQAAQAPRAKPLAAYNSATHWTASSVLEVLLDAEWSVAKGCPCESCSGRPHHHTSSCQLIWHIEQVRKEVLTTTPVLGAKLQSYLARRSKENG